MQPNNPRNFDINPAPTQDPVSTNVPSAPEKPITHEQPPANSVPTQPVVGGTLNLPVGDSHSQVSTNTKQRKREEIKNLIYTILFFATAIVIPVFMILFVFQSYVVDGSSMEPTLQNNNRVFILKLPKTIAKLQNKDYMPARNEVIVFKKPTNDGTQLIKRVIGLPGDRVVIEDGKITVYNIDHPEGFNPDAGTEYEGALEPVSTGGQTVTEDVGQGELFVLGDNRGPGGSLDSHSGLGLVPVQNIVGRLWVRYFPLSEFQTFANLISSVLSAQAQPQKYK